MIFKKIIFLLCAINLKLVFASAPLYNQDEIKIHFFNVGQGNCTLVKYSDYPPLIVDAGSRAKGEIPEFGDYQDSEWTSTVKNLLYTYISEPCMFSPNTIYVVIKSCGSRSL